MGRITKVEKQKKILDSVHGYISIPEKIFDEFIDTMEFQRLRRIEQMSIRSLFPCARHDRFMHSLGVYHLGHKILESIKNNSPLKAVFPDNKEIIFKSYELACLLHDVGHAPFSHTFENYYKSKQNLRNLLIQALSSSDFTKDFTPKLCVAAPHEIMSAYVVVNKFADKISQMNADLELIVRMIVGCKYQNKTTDWDFKNAFVDLIHGDIVDADRLDYVMRDTWASGYSAASVDVDRLIDGIYIHRSEDFPRWQVCYSQKALNEIDAVLSIKRFQKNNAVSHHIVVLEQYLLVESMKSVAINHYADSQLNRDEALRKLCNVKTLIEKVEGNPLIFPDDCDFVSLMKNNIQDKFVQQWFSRQYDYIPLWKSKGDFYKFFPRLLFDNEQSNWLYSRKCKKFIMKLLNTQSNSDVCILPIDNAGSTSKKVQPAEIMLLIGEDIVPYTNVFGKKNEEKKANSMPLKYIFISKKYSEKIDLILSMLEAMVNYQTAVDARQNSQKTTETHDVTINAVQIIEKTVKKHGMKISINIEKIFSISVSDTHENEIV